MRGENLNDFEKEDVLARVAAVFDTIEKDYISRVDASPPAVDVHHAVVDRVEQLLSERSN